VQRTRRTPFLPPAAAAIPVAGRAEYGARRTRSENPLADLSQSKQCRTPHDSDSLSNAHLDETDASIRAATESASLDPSTQIILLPDAKPRDSSDAAQVDEGQQRDRLSILSILIQAGSVSILSILIQAAKSVRSSELVHEEYTNGAFIFFFANLCGERQAGEAAPSACRHNKSDGRILMQTHSVGQGST
jgi:hypothetical protein